VATSNLWLNVFLVLDCLFLAGLVLWNLSRRSRRKRLLTRPVADQPGIPQWDDKTVAFEAESAVLTPSAQRDLEEVAAHLGQFPTLKVTLEGSADDTGNLTRNRRLSQGRAEAARQFLVDRGVAPKRIAMVALEPARGLNEADRQRLRRTTVRWESP
jgi:outer membrane protein OmpA-like peptidoglycan-associated protein